MRLQTGAYPSAHPLKHTSVGTSGLWEVMFESLEFPIHGILEFSYSWKISGIEKRPQNHNYGRFQEQKSVLFRVSLCIPLVLEKMSLLCISSLVFTSFLLSLTITRLSDMLSSQLQEGQGQEALFHLAVKDRGFLREPEPGRLCVKDGLILNSFIYIVG